MNKFPLLLFIAAITLSCNHINTGSNDTDPEVTAGTAKGVAFGAAVEEANVLTAAQLETAVAGKDSIQATVAAEIVESCQAKGCWMDVKLSENQTMKVTFRDYSFFVPVEDLKGRQVVFTGTAKREVISVEDQRHYAKDAGKLEREIAAITQPKEELRFVADGVILK